MDDDNTKLINKFSILVGNIIELIDNYNNLNLKISKLTNDRIKILNINQYQDKDDLNFYNSIFEDTIYFLRKSVSVRKKKLKRDIVNNVKYLNKNVSSQLYIDTIDKKECVEHFTRYVNQRNQNNYRWVKNDKSKELKQWVKDFDEVIKYHLYVYEYLLKVININNKFFRSKDTDNDDFSIKYHKGTNTDVDRLIMENYIDSYNIQNRCRRCIEAGRLPSENESTQTDNIQNENENTQTENIQNENESTQTEDVPIENN